MTIKDKLITIKDKSSTTDFMEYVIDDVITFRNDEEIILYLKNISNSNDTICTINSLIYYSDIKEVFEKYYENILEVCNNWYQKHNEFSFEIDIRNLTKLAYREVVLNICNKLDF